MTSPRDRADVERFRDLVRRRLGLDFDDTKLEQLADVLERRLDARRAGMAAYLDRLEADHPPEWRALAEELTVAETHFFRNQDHFRALVEVVLPECTRVAAAARPVRILSAGTATGEEAYTLAIATRERFPLAGPPDVRIVGIDLNPRALERAVRAKYSPWSLRETPVDVRERYFSGDGRSHDLREIVRSMVSFEERNLMDDDPHFWCADAFDVVFCRNVLMYLTQDAMRAVIARVSRSLRPGGFLFLGHAEALRGLAQNYHLCHTHNTFYYRRHDGHSPKTEPAALEAHQASASRASSATPAPALDLGDSSWIHAIGRATERITTLTERAREGRGTVGSETGRFAPAATTGARDRVLEMMREERFGDALDVLRSLGSEQDAEVALLHAVLLTNAGKIADAERACEQVLRVDELNAGAHYLTALCREHAGDRAAAVAHDQTATYLEPAFAMPHLHLGLLERRAGHRAKAREHLRRALELLPAEDSSRILLFGGGFGRKALLELCHAELRRCEG
ncbi:MAG TPA: CheR family methyltransferase [Polyangiaceae bacterium]|nr:CheR family methyltransferase [Polyangiaceae bacterium]